MMLLIKFLAGPLFGFLLSGLLDLFFPSAKVQASGIFGGQLFANALFWGALASFLAYVGIRDKAADAAKPTVLSRFLGVIRAAFVAVLAGVYKLFAEAKVKAGG